MNDVVVVLPGILGSTLARDGKEVWSPSAGSVLRAIRTFGGSLKRMERPQGIGDEHPRDGVEPVRLMPDLHILPGVWSPVIGYAGLLDFLRSRFEVAEGRNLLPVPYDWRLSNRYNGRRLAGIVEPALERWRAQGGACADAQLVFICHSMGGLVARWYIEKEGGRAFTRKLITLGTPYRGSLKALEQLVNGVRIGVGPFKMNLTAFSRSIPSLYQLLPEYACIADSSTEGLRKISEVTLPDVNGRMAADAVRFHDELNDAAAKAGQGDFHLHPIVGTRQPTWTTAELVNGVVHPIETINGADESGDATVPRLSIPKELPPDSPTIRAIANEHGSLQQDQGVLVELEFALTANPIVHRVRKRAELGVRVDELIMTGEPLVVEATLSDPQQRAMLVAMVTDEAGKQVSQRTLTGSGGVYRTTFPSLPSGAHRVMVGAVGFSGRVDPSARVAPLSRTVLVWDPGEQGEP